MLHPYVAAALLSAHYESDTDGSTWATVPALSDTTAAARTYGGCQQQLRQAIERRIHRAVTTGEPLPTLHGVTPPTSFGDAPTRRR